MQKEHKEIQTTQTSLQNQDCDTQTDPIVPETKLEIESSAKKNSEKQLEETESSIVDEASEYVKRYTDLLDSQMSFQSASASTLKKKPVASVFILLVKKIMIVQKKAATQKTARSTMSEKENWGMTINESDDKASFAADNLRKEKAVLTEELINLNKEISRLRVIFVNT